MNSNSYIKCVSLSPNLGDSTSVISVLNVWRNSVYRQAQIFHDHMLNQDPDLRNDLIFIKRSSSR